LELAPDQASRCLSLRAHVPWLKKDRGVCRISLFSLFSLKHSEGSRFSVAFMLQFSKPATFYIGMDAFRKKSPKPGDELAVSFAA